MRPALHANQGDFGVRDHPARGIGATTLTRLAYLATTHDIGIWEVINRANEFPDISAAASKLTHFAMMITAFRGGLSTKNAYELATEVSKSTGLMKTLYEDKSIEGISRYENTTELLNSIQEFVEDDESEDEKTLANFLEKVALYTDDDKEKDPNRDCVSLMTIHASKGLEFPVVHIVGMEENLFPSQMALMNRNELEEERRLFYVAITRAEQKLYLSFATSRFKHGNLLHCEPSRFIGEIESSYLDMSLSAMQKQSQFQGNAPNPVVHKSQPTQNTRIFTTQKPSVPLPPEDPNFVAADISGLQIGDAVQHQRFGKGIVVMIEGQGDSRKAQVNFDQIGMKTLVLKFAKMRIL